VAQQGEGHRQRCGGDQHDPARLHERVGPLEEADPAEPEADQEQADDLGDPPGRQVEGPFAELAVDRIGADQLAERGVGDRGKAGVGHEQGRRVRPGGAVPGGDDLRGERRLKQDQEGEQQQDPIVADAIEQEQHQAGRREHLQDVAAIDEAMNQPDQEEQSQPPDEAAAKVDSAPAGAVHDDREAEAEAQGEQREGLAGEDRHGGVEPGIGHGMDPVELEQLDRVDQEQAHQGVAPQSVHDGEARRRPVRLF